MASRTDPDLRGCLIGGRYRVAEVIGRGGMSLVYRAHDERFGTTVAVKVLRADLAERPHCRERFLRETRVSGRVAHPNIVQVYSCGPAPGGSLYLALEYLEGIDLRRLLSQRGPLPWSELRPWILQAIGGLAAAHEHGIVHRDVKPSNLFLTEVTPQRRPRAKLLDFGIARLRGEEGRGVTLPGRVVGTPAYMSPEMAIGRPADARSDIYAMGVSLYQLLTGRLPFEVKTVQDVVVNGRCTPPHTLRREIPVGVSEAIVRALSRRPADRFHTVREFGDVLALVEAVDAPPGEPLAWTRSIAEALDASSSVGPAFVDDAMTEVDGEPASSSWFRDMALAGTAGLLAGVTVAGLWISLHSGG